jgi:tetratricopeptide (TPR) repeat protein
VFIIRDGTINWIGSPFAMDDPLAQIVSGKWDLEQAAEMARLERERDQKIRALYQQYNKAKYVKDWEAAIAILDSIVAIDPEIEVKYGGPKFEYLLRLGKYEQAYAYGRAFVAGAAWEHAGALNYVAWMIVDPDAKLARKDLELALEAATRADALSDNDEPAIIDTLAKVYFDMGKIEEAIMLQQKAVRLASEKELHALLPDLERRLEQYENASTTEGI